LASAAFRLRRFDRNARRTDFADEREAFARWTQSWPRGREIVSGKAPFIGNDLEMTGRTALEADLALAAPDRGDQGPLATLVVFAMWRISFAFSGHLGLAAVTSVAITFGAGVGIDVLEWRAHRIRGQ
jgi:hypothetical protein